MKNALAILLLLGIATTAAAQVTDETENYKDNLLKYPIVTLENKSFAKKINKEIANKVAELKKQHTSMKGAADKISMSYKVLLENDNRLNMLLYSWTYCNGAAHGLYYTYGLSYDLHKNKKAIPRDYIGSPNPQTLDEGVRLGIFKLTNTEDRPVSLTDFWKIENVSKECLVNDDGSLTLIYQPYDLAPYAFGNTFLTIPASEFTVLNGKQPKQHIKNEKKLAKNEQNSKLKAIKLQKQQEKLQAKNELRKLKENQKAEMIKLKTQQKEQLLEYKLRHKK